MSFELAFQYFQPTLSHTAQDDEGFPDTFQDRQNQDDFVEDYRDVFTSVRKWVGKSFVITSKTKPPASLPAGGFVSHELCTRLGKASAFRKSSLNG
jgi:hypothetical protein